MNTQRMSSEVYLDLLGLAIRHFIAGEQAEARGAASEAERQFHQFFAIAEALPSS